MGLIVVKTDFKGKYKVGGTNFDAVDKYIDRYEEPLLIDLLGVTLFNLFKASLSPGPIGGVYKTIFDPIRMDDKGNCPAIRVSRGMKEMLLGLIWFEFIRDTEVKMTNAGPKKDKAEVSEDINPEFAYQRYNEAVHDWQTIRWYICKNKTQYPDYNGQDLGIAHWAL